MPTFNLNRFSRPEILRRIDREHLLAFLSPHADYFAARGAALPPSGGGGRLDYDALGRVLLTPDGRTPDDLAEALFYVNEVLAPEAFDAVQDEIAGTPLDAAIGEDVTPADVAVRVWLSDRRIIEKVHAEQFFVKVRAFEYFKTATTPPPDLAPPSRETLAALEADLDEWFAARRRGRYTRVFVYPRAGRTWFLVRHGKPYVREAVIDGGESASRYFRPERFDVLAYNPVVGEIRMNAQTRGERELYRKQFGLHLFGSEAFFGEQSRFDLEPLRRVGEEALLCADVSGIERVRLKELQISWGGAHKDVVVQRSEDLFASLRDREKTLPEGGRLVKAGFQITFTGARTPRSVVLTSGNRAQFKRDADADAIETWLGLRGFIVGDGAAADA